MNVFGSRHDAVVLPTRSLPTGFRNTSLFDSDGISPLPNLAQANPRHAYVFGMDQHQVQSPGPNLSLMLDNYNEELPALMEDYYEEEPNNVASNIYSQEVQTPNNWNPEEFTMATSPQAELDGISRLGLISVQEDYFSNDITSLVSNSQYGTNLTAADLERNISPLADEISPRTMTAMVTSLADEYQDTDMQKLQQRQSSSFCAMDTGAITYHEHSSHNSVVSAMLSGCVSSEAAAGEQLQLMGAAATSTPHATAAYRQPSVPVSPQAVASPTYRHTPSPRIVATSSPALTPKHQQCSDVEQSISPDGEVTVVFNQHAAASASRNWYGALTHIVPEVIHPQPFVRKELLTIQLPKDSFPLVKWCQYNRSGKIRALIIQKLLKMYTDLHHNKLAKGLCFFGSLTFCKSVFVSVTPMGEPKLHLVPYFPAFWEFAHTKHAGDASTPRKGRLLDVMEFVKALDHAVLQPVKNHEFMVSSAFYSACEFCKKEGTEPDKMPLFYKRLAAHKLACVQLCEGHMTHDVVAFSHEIMESTLSKLSRWRVVKPTDRFHPNTVVYGLYSGPRMVLCAEELAGTHFAVSMRKLPLDKVKKMIGQPLLLTNTN